MVQFVRRVLMMRANTAVIFIAPVVVAMAVLGAAAALASGDSEEETNPTGGETVNQESAIQMREVQSPEWSDAQNGSRPPQPGHDPRKFEMIDAIKEQVGELYLPTCLPEGFSVDGTWIEHGQPNVSYTGAGLHMAVTQSTYPATPQVKEGYAEEITVSGHNGFLIRGAWHRVVHAGQSADSVERVWNPDFMLTVILDMGGKWVMIYVSSDPVKKGFDEEELLRIAGSLAPF
jgi:hypothetical protein